MSTNVLVNSLKTALFLAPLLIGCGGGVNSGGVVVPTGGFTVPDCAEGQLIGVNADRTLYCVSALSGRLTPPSCAAGTQALTSEKGVLSCVNKGMGANDVTTITRIDTDVKAVNDLRTKVDLLKSGGGSLGKYVGLTDTMVNGAMDSGNGQNPKGLTSATTMCTAKFGAGAHMCSVLEIYESAATGVFTQQADVAAATGAWVYMEGWNGEPVNGGVGSDPGAGLTDNCASYTYPTGDKRWTGTAFRWATQTFSGIKMAKLNVAVGCATKLPIVCCK